MLLRSVWGRAGSRTPTGPARWIASVTPRGVGSANLSRSSGSSTAGAGSSARSSRASSADRCGRSGPRPAGSSSSRGTANGSGPAGSSSPRVSHRSPGDLRSTRTCRRSSPPTPWITATCRSSRDGVWWSSAVVRARSRRRRSCTRAARRSTSSCAIRWLSRPERTSRALAGMLCGWPDLGPAGVDHIVARPTVYRRLLRHIGRWLGLRTMRPATARWLEDRLAKVTVHTGVRLVDARRWDGRVALRLDDGSTRTADHVLLATAPASTSPGTTRA